jgi:hypothetical protein
MQNNKNHTKEFKSDKEGHKFTKEYKLRVVAYHEEHDKDLAETIEWVRIKHPCASNHIIRSWVDPVFAEKVRVRSNAANKKWQIKNPVKYEDYCKGRKFSEEYKSSVNEFYKNNNNSIAITIKHVRDQFPGTNTRTVKMWIDKEYAKKEYAKLKKYNQNWNNQNKDRVREYDRLRRAANPGKTLARIKERKKIDIGFRILENMRVYLYQQLKRAHGGIPIKKSQKTIEYIGCTRDELNEHLRKQYKLGMTDENYGSWHVDHIIPCSLFDLTDFEQAKKCFHYTNLQPLWAVENLKKSNNIL